MKYSQNMSKTKTYTEELLPDLISKLKLMVEKNFEIINKDVEGSITEDKFHNVLKGRRMAAEHSVWGMRKIDNLEKQLNPDREENDSSYYKEMLPELIDKLKAMIIMNLPIIDMDIDEEDGDFDDLKNVSKDLEEFFGSDITKKILKHAAGNGQLPEDKYPNVLKGRKMAAEDIEWAMTEIDKLLNELNKTEEEVKKPRMSHAKRAAEMRKQ